MSEVIPDATEAAIDDAPALAGETAEPLAEEPPPEEPLAEEPPPEELLAAEPLAEEPPEPAVDAAELLGMDVNAAASVDEEQTILKAMVEAAVYVAEEPLTLDQLAIALEQPKERVAELLIELAGDYSSPRHGITIREIAGGFQMVTKPEHHERIQAFVRRLKPPLKLSLAALETLAVIAYKQPITAPEIMDVRGVQGAGVLKTLIDRKMITTAGRKQVVGKPILYKTTREFLVQFGLKDLAELPTLKEFEELRRLAFSDDEPAAPPAEQESQPAEAAAEPPTE